ncbi:MAG: pseudouridine synthase [Treponema sp.]|nr:pseudouridine synthase [Treponema sp.]
MNCEHDFSSGIYIAMNKPVGYVCSYVSDSHKTVYELLSPSLHSLMQLPRGKKIHTIGRLDCDTSGLLLFTTDGYFSNYLTRSENHIEKTYEVVLRDEVPLDETVSSSGLIRQSLTQPNYVALFKKGLLLPAEKKFSEQLAAPAEIEFLSTNRCHVKIKEGKFHQVRRMFRAVGNEVIELKRIKIGDFELPADLKIGEYRDFIPEEIITQ